MNEIRRSTRALCLVALLPVGLAGSAQAARDIPKPNYDEPVPNFKLTDLSGKSYDLSACAKDKGAVVAFLGLGCPLSNLYTPRLQRIADRYASKGVTFLVVNSNYLDSREDLATWASQWKLRIPLLKDAGNKVADRFGAYRTNEVFLLDPDLRITYHGCIDDQYGIGYQRARPDHTYLIDAIEQQSAGKPITTSRTAAAGCVIGRELEPKAETQVTYHNHIERIIQNNCRSCHRPGQIGPFELTSFEDAKGWAGMIREVVEQRRMPPWLANPKYGSFRNDRSLSEEEIEQILSWVDDGAPKGDPSDAPPPMSYPEGGWVIGKPDMVLELLEPFDVPAEGVVEYQYFSVPTNFDEDKWVVAAEVKPGEPSVVHHVICFIRPGEEARKYDQIQRRKERGEDPQEAEGDREADHAGRSGGGFLPDRVSRALARRRRGGRGGFSGGMLSATVPGAMPFVAPEGCAKRVPKGSNIVFQMHYTPNGRAVRDLTKVGIIFAKKPPKYALKVAAAGNYTFRIPPYDGDFRCGAKFPVKKDIRIVGFTPHMHLRGKSFRYEAVYPDGREQILLDVPRYDFGWQITYEPEKPIFLPKGTEIFCHASYDNSESNPYNPDPSAEVRWGDQSWEEMFLGWFSYIDSEPIDHSRHTYKNGDDPTTRQRASAN